MHGLEPMISNAKYRILAIDPGSRFAGLSCLLCQSHGPMPIGTLDLNSKGLPTETSRNISILEFCRRAKFDTIVCGLQSPPKLFPILSYIVGILNFECDKVRFVNESFTSSLSGLSKTTNSLDVHTMAALHIMDLYLTSNQMSDKISANSRASDDDLS